MTSRKIPPRAVMLPACAAVMLGVGAAGAVSLYLDSGRILMSENGGPFREIRLGENEDADRLRALLISAGASAVVPVAPTVVADGGQSPSWPKKDEPTPPPKDSSMPPPKSKKAARPKSG
jgi:hypothetical protein